MAYVCQDDEECAGIKVRTANVLGPWEASRRLVDSYCSRYDQSRSWYPIPSRNCFPIDFDKYNPGVEEELQRRREQKDWE